MPNIREIPQADDAPVAEPVSLVEARAQVRLDVGEDGTHEDDGTLASLITAARQAAEAFTGRLFTAATYELRLDAFDSELEIPVAPVGSVVSIQYLDAAALLQTLDPAAYWLDDHPDAPALLAVPGASFPTPLAMPGSVRVRFTGGYGVGHPVPRAVVQAILLIVGHLYENRQDVIVNATATELPQGSRALLWPYRRGLGV